MTHRGGRMIAGLGAVAKAAATSWRAATALSGLLLVLDAPVLEPDFDLFLA